MKNFWLALLILITTSNCANTGHKKTKAYHKNLSNKKTKKTDRKFSQRIKPSESMQAGIAKETTKYVFKNSDTENLTQNLQDDDSLKLVTEDSEAQTKDNGEYIGHFKVGNPYQIFGVSYFPQNYEDYEEIGTASWYGDDFHGKPTANGEVYNMTNITAAHPTLPLPSLVRVTNLRNNKSVIVRVNDRGPFAKSRVIDVSERAADLLGFKDQGTTEVKVQLLRNDTDELLQKLKIKN